MLENRKRFSATLENGLNDKLKELSNITRIPKSRLLDEAIIDILKKYEKKLDFYKE